MLCFLSAILLYACDAPEYADDEKPDLEKIKATLQSMEDAYALSENNKNTDGMKAYYADDAQSLPANEPTVVGKAAILSRHEQGMASDTSGNKIEFQVMEVFADGDLIVEVGRSITTDPQGNQTSGKYISVFEEKDDKLVCIRDIWNEDQALRE